MDKSTNTGKHRKAAKFGRIGGWFRRKTPSKRDNKQNRKSEDPCSSEKNSASNAKMENENSKSETVGENWTQIEEKDVNTKNIVLDYENHELKSKKMNDDDTVVKTNNNRSNDSKNKDLVNLKNDVIEVPSRYGIGLDERNTAEFKFESENTEGKDDIGLRGKQGVTSEDHYGVRFMREVAFEPIDEKTFVSENNYVKYEHSGDGKMQNEDDTKHYNYYGEESESKISCIIEPCQKNAAESTLESKIVHEGRVEYDDGNFVEDGDNETSMHEVVLHNKTNVESETKETISTDEKISKLQNEDSVVSQDQDIKSEDELDDRSDDRNLDKSASRFRYKTYVNSDFSNRPQ